MYRAPEADRQGSTRLTLTATAAVWPALGPLVSAFEAAGYVVEARTFVREPGDEDSRVLLLALFAPAEDLAALVTTLDASVTVAPALSAALFVPDRPASTALQLKASDTFVSMTMETHNDLQVALHALTGRLIPREPGDSLVPVGGERRLVHSSGHWIVE